MDKKHKQILLMFASQYPSLYQKTKRWSPTGTSSMIIQLYNGDGYLYDMLEGLTYRVKIIRDPMKLTEDEWKRGFSFNLKRLLKSKHIKQKCLADSLGLREGTVSRYIKGSSVPNSYILHRIELILRCSQEDLFPSNYIPVD